MKKMLLLLPLLVFSSFAKGQKVELSAQIYSGLSKFTGVSAVRNSVINYPESPTRYTNNPYGARYAPGYGAGVQAQVIFLNHIILGSQVSHEQLRTRVNLVGIAGFNSNIEVEGKTILKNNLTNLHPFIGGRFKIAETDFDLTIGTDIGYFRKRKESGKAVTSAGDIVTTSRDRGVPESNDIRPRISLTAYKKNIGFTASYAKGLMNHLEGYVGGRNEAYLQVLRFGIAYRIGLIDN